MDNLLSLQELFNHKIFRIPDYQRGYSWQKQQLEEFWDDLLSLLPDQDHYTGMLSLKEVNRDDIIRNHPDKWTNERWLVEGPGYSVNEIVDGQQRLTTLIILINEILNYCEEHNITTINSDELSAIESQYLFRQKPGNIIRTYMFGYESDNPSYEYFRIAILGDPEQDDSEKDPANLEETLYTLNLDRAKQFFKNKLKNLSLSEVEEIYRKITVKLKFNLYNIKDNFNVFVAFETMNNRGKPLSHLELLKNRLIYLSTLFEDDKTDKSDEREAVRQEIRDAWREIYDRLGHNKTQILSDDEFLRHHWLIYFGYQTQKVQGNKTIPFSDYLLGKFFIQQNINRRSLDISDDSDDFSEDSVVESDLRREAEADEEYDSAADTEMSTKLDSPNYLTLGEIKRYVNSLSRLVPFWYQTYDPSAITNSEIAKYLFRLNILGYVNARPLVTVILSKRNIDDDTKVECLRRIERFNFLYYRLNNYSSTYNSTVFYGLARDLYYGVINIDKVLSTVNGNDDYYLSSDHTILSNGPIEKFSRLMRQNGYYSWSALKYLLYIYDLDKAGTAENKRKINPDEYFRQDSKDKKDGYSVEHIYPQTPKLEYWTSRFNQYSAVERKILAGSLGNLLPLSARINKSMQNSSFDDKKNGTDDRERGYINGSSSEMEVAEYDEWTPENILERGMRILKFMENEFDFKFPDDTYRRQILGLEFMKRGDDAEDRQE